MACAARSTQNASIHVLRFCSQSAGGGGSSLIQSAVGSNAVTRWAGSNAAAATVLAAFMAGMAANISAFNTVFSYDLWQQYVKKDRPDMTIQLSLEDVMVEPRAATSIGVRLVTVSMSQVTARPASRAIVASTIDASSSTASKAFRRPRSTSSP